MQWISAWSRSPRWHDGRLWFSDWIAGRSSPSTTRAESEVVVSHSSLPLCFDFLPDGRPLLVSNQAMALLTVEDDGTLVSYADLSGPLAVRVQRHCRRRPRDRLCQQRQLRVHRRTAGGSRAARLRGPGDARARGADRGADLAFPNGMAVSADNASLVVADSYRHELVGFDIGRDGTLSGRQVWADLGEAAPDWHLPRRRGRRLVRRCAAPALRARRRGGAVLDTVALDRGGFACMLGGRGWTRSLHRGRPVAGHGRDWVATRRGRAVPHRGRRPWRRVAARD